MRFSFADYDVFTGEALKRERGKLTSYREHVRQTTSNFDESSPEFSLAYPAHPELEDTVAKIKQDFKRVKHLLLIGIGGSSLGVEAIHQVLDEGNVKLTVLDTISAYETAQAIQTLTSYKKVSDIAVCIISKSGTTTETVVNAAVILKALTDAFGAAVHSQILCVGDSDTDLAHFSKKHGLTHIAIPKIIGGRFSVGTAVGLVPLAMLQHDTEAFLEGFLASHDEPLEEAVADSAARLAVYLQKKYTHYNFFAFEKRLEALGRWYRQLLAESIGKSTDKAGKPVSKGFVPTISTPVELHSISQLYLSGFSGVYTDFVTFDDETVDFKIPKVGLGKKFSSFTVQEVTTALYGGVVGAYHEKRLPHRTTIFEDDRAYELGLFMAMRLRETMYVAHLLNLNAFDQPNVELYKQKTKTILGL